MRASSAAFFCENFAGMVSVFAGASGTARAPLTNAAFGSGCVPGACALGSSAPILPDGVCCQFSSCKRCCASDGGGCCWAAATPTPPTNASASVLVRKRSRMMGSCPDDHDLSAAACAGKSATPAFPAQPRRSSADSTAKPRLWFHGGCGGHIHPRQPLAPPPTAPPLGIGVRPL